MEEKTYANEVSSFVIQDGVEISEREVRVLTFAIEDASCAEGCGYPYRFAYLWSMSPNEVLFRCGSSFKIYLITGKKQLVILQGKYKNDFLMTVKALLHLIKACNIQVINEEASFDVD